MATPARSAPPDPALSFRVAAAADAGTIHALIEASLDEGHLLPRTLDDVRAHAPRFQVVEDEGVVVACAELAPLSAAVAEVRSLVVSAAYRGRGLGPALVERLRQQARVDGYATLCAFTHEPSHFVRLGFSIVPHVWFPEKVAIDCTACPKFRQCGQHAMALPLDGVSLAAPHGSHTRLPITLARRGLPAALPRGAARLKVIA
ncbi:MAG: GNAT family N-acetyltransferase [Acidobacteria bacterium]|nr:GNAT family N-acetyltransferase [Acidobacteriota bacterium]